MTDNAKKFMEKLSNDEALQAELTAALEWLEKEEQIPAMIEFARKKGFELTQEDFAADEADLSMEELDTVVGAGGCGCAVAGVGKGDGLFCVCTGYGKGLVNTRSYISSQGGCVCLAAGAGATRRH